MISDRPPRVERVLNLLACLLNTARPLTRDEIAAQVDGYPPGGESQRRAFERDKEMLRAMGVPISVEVLADGVEQGYRVNPSEYYLPDLGLDDLETAALNVAVNAVTLDVGAPGSGALLKLGRGDSSATAPIAALGDAPALVDAFDAMRRHAPLVFDYRGETRTVDPYSVTCTRGRWYMVGRDHDRGALRTFRLDRVDPDSVTVGADGSFVVPDDIDPGAAIDSPPWQYGADELETALVAVDASVAEEFARITNSESEARGDTFVFTVEFSDLGAFRTLVLGFGERVEVLEPVGVREHVMAWLGAIVDPKRKPPAIRGDRVSTTRARGKQ